MFVVNVLSNLFFAYNTYIHLYSVPTRMLALKEIEICMMYVPTYNLSLYIHSSLGFLQIFLVLRSNCILIRCTFKVMIVCTYVHLSKEW